MTNKDNGAGAPPQVDTYKGQKVVELVLDSGEIAHVKPLSLWVLRGLLAKAEKLFPYPDKAEYEIPIDPEKTAIPGLSHPAEDNPDYQALVAQIDDERNEWAIEQTIELACEWPAGKDTLITKYAPQLEVMSDILDIEDDDWQATVKYCLIGSINDRNNIWRAAQGQLMLTEGEVRDAMRIFRPVVSRPRHPSDHRESESSGA